VEDTIIKFHKNLSSRSRVNTCAETYGYVKAKRRFSCLCESARNYTRLQLDWNMHMRRKNIFLFLNAENTYTVRSTQSEFPIINFFTVPKSTISINIHVFTPHQFPFKINEKRNAHLFSKNWRMKSWIQIRFG
jgi:hypothetical protein